MPQPVITVKLAVPAPLWKRWSASHQGEEGDLSSLLLTLLEDHLLAEEQRRAHIVGFDWQI